MISSDLAMLVWQPKQQQQQQEEEEDEEEDEEEKQQQQHRHEQRPFACTFIGCEKTYKRGDHLNRHMLTHGGKRFLCPYKGCGQAFTMNSNLQRHLRGHEQRFPTTTTTSSQVFGGGFPAAAHFSENERVECLEPGCGRLFLSPWGLRGHEFHAHGKRLACPEPGCGKAFRFPSCLQTHQEHVHGKMSAEDMTTVCLEPGCGETFQGVTELRLHKKASHSSVVCDICGMSMMRTSLKQHLVTHEDETRLFPCSFPGCLHSYTTKSNLNQHVTAVHKELKPYICSHVDCGRQFAYRAVRDRHEMSGLHFPSQGDFELEDAKFRGMQRGGRKRLFLHSVEDLLRQKKRHS
ncbi:hypothetical protein BDL97_03G129800 [Sphagnum fallax]|nr:hypothetical protein BDL97_03G129800 [Sphagnum fallax]